MAKRRFTSREDAEKTALFAMESGSKQRLEDYLRRGRGLASMTEDAMEIAFVKIFEILADDPGHPAGRAMSDDLLAEYEVRDVKPPFAKHPDLMRGYLQAFDDFAANLTPGEKAEVDRRFWEAYEAGKASVN